MNDQPHNPTDLLALARRVNTLRKQANDHDGIPHTKLNPKYRADNPHLPAYREALRALVEAQRK
jgi:hypothetical protein